MLSENTPISIRFSDEFEENLYRLSKRFRNIRKDVVYNLLKNLISKS